MNNASNVTLTKTIKETPKNTVTTGLFWSSTWELSVVPFKTDAAGSRYAVITTMDPVNSVYATSTFAPGEMYSDYDTSYTVRHGRMLVTTSGTTQCTTYTNSTATLRSHPTITAAGAESSSDALWGVPPKDGHDWLPVWQSVMIRNKSWWKTAFPEEAPFQSCTFGVFTAYNSRFTEHHFALPPATLSTVGWITETSTSYAHAGAQLTPASSASALPAETQSIPSKGDPVTASRFSTSASPGSTAAGSVEATSTPGLAGGIASAIESAAEASKSAAIPHETSNSDVPSQGQGGAAINTSAQSEDTSASNPPIVLKTDSSLDEPGTSTRTQAGPISIPAGLVSAVQSAAASASEGASIATEESPGSSELTSVLGTSYTPAEADTTLLASTVSVSQPAAFTDISLVPTSLVTSAAGSPTTIPAYVIDSQTVPLGSTVVVSNTPIAIFTLSSKTFYAIGTHGTITEASTFAMSTAEGALPTAIPDLAVEFTTLMTSIAGKPTTLAAYIVDSNTAALGSTVTVSNTPIEVFTSAGQTLYAIGPHDSMSDTSTFALASSAPSGQPSATQDRGIGGYIISGLGGSKVSSTPSMTGSKPSESSGAIQSAKNTTTQSPGGGSSDGATNPPGSTLSPSAAAASSRSVFGKWRGTWLLLPGFACVFGSG